MEEVGQELEDNGSMTIRPPWQAIVALAAGAGCLVFAAFALGPARAAEQPPAGRQWAIERCVDDRCGVLAWRYSGPTSCNVDAHSERVAKQQASGTRLSCVRINGEMKR